MLRICLAVFFCLALATAAPRDDTTKSENKRPIIGILALEVGKTPLSQYGNYSSHIAASYVKYLESSGARVVPILINKGLSYYRKIIKSVNGIFIPGFLAAEDVETEILARAVDASPRTITGAGYALGGYLLFNLAKQANQQGIYLPVWGTCLGFQLLTFLSAGPSLRTLGVRKPCRSNNQMLPLEFTSEAESSRLFKDAPEHIMEILREENVSAHFHSYCVTEETMDKFELQSWWRVLTTNHDFDGLKFVSTIEARNLPFYGSIYHPEKNGFEWTEREDTPHDLKAVQMMQYYGNFFVNEARKNNNKFASQEEEEAALIYNYKAIYTGDKTVYQQTYFFD